MSIAQQLQEAADVRVSDVDFVSGQEPADDLDPEFVTDVEATFTISGRTLAQLMGRQQRVLEAALKKMNNKEAIRLISHGSSRAVRPILAALRGKVSRLINSHAAQHFERGAQIKQMEFSEDTSYWTAKVDSRKQNIQYTIELGVLCKWSD